MCNGSTYIDRYAVSRASVEGTVYVRKRNCKPLDDNWEESAPNTPRRGWRINNGKSVREDLSVHEDLTADHLRRKKKQRNECEQHVYAVC